MFNDQYKDEDLSSLHFDIFLLINLYPFDGLLSHGDLLTWTPIHAKIKYVKCSATLF